MTRSCSWWLPALLCGVLVGDALAAPTGTVVLEDGRKWDNVQYEIKNGRMYVTFPNNRGGIDVPMSEVKSYRADTTAPPVAEGDDDAAAEGAAAGAQGGPTTLDWEGRFRLEPPEGWQAVAPSSPLMRAQLRHAEKDAGLAVYIRQVQGDWDLGKAAQLPKPIADEITADLASRYAKVNGGRIERGTLFDAPVVRVDGAQVTELGSSTLKKLVEVRFRRFGLEYSLSYLVAPNDEAALAPTLPRLFEAFTFLPAVTHAEGLYSDYGRGFAIERANEDWLLQGAPFDADQPVRISTDKGRAELLVEVHAGTDPESVVRGIIARRQKTSRALTNDKVEAADLGGTPVKRFQFEDYRDQGSSKMLLFRGFAALLAGKVVVFTGVHPMSDDDARKLSGDLDTMLASIRLWDADRIRDQLSKAQNALALVAQGANASAAKRHQEALQKFDEAIQLMPGFARAYFLRAQTKKDLGDFNGQRADLEQAAQLDPAAGYDAALVESYAAEARAAEAAKNWPEALKLNIRVYRSQKNDPNLRKVIAAAQAFYTDLKKDMRQLDRTLNRLDTDLKPFAAEAPMVAFLQGTYRDATANFLREKKFREAKKWADKLKKIAPDAKARQDAEALIAQVEQQADAARNQQR